MYKQIIVPLDGTELAVDTVAKAVDFAKILGARLVFLHAPADFGSSGDGALLHSFAPEQFSVLAKGEASAVLSIAEVEARRLGVPYESVSRASSRPHEVILEVAAEYGCDLIFMASHGRRGVKGLLFASQTEKVLAHTKIPVLISSIESNAHSPEMDRALSIIKGEHRSLAAAMHGLKLAVEQLKSKEAEADIPLLRSMIFYFRNFTERLHHPREESHLFRLLQKRTAEADEALTVLKSQHAQEGDFLSRLEMAVDAYADHPDVVGLDELSESVMSYSDRMWEHMRLEEKVILPLCVKQLTTDDWLDIAHAFESNGDPKLDQDLKLGYQKLFVRLMNIVRDSHQV